jgi:elongation factor P hydroxylase
MPGWIEHLNTMVLLGYGTRLVGGFHEPLYKAARASSLAEIRFTRDYERSALHELAHWSIAGKQRRLVDDYDYWYEPDGRSDEQQALFFDVEVKPQTVEKHFCHALEIPFEVSVDNLGNRPRSGAGVFKNRVDTQYSRYLAEGFPPRAIQIYNCMRQWRTHHDAHQARD